MPSIYLAKSNSCSLSTVTAIRDYLSTLPHVVLKEFKGGTYSNADLLSSDYLMIIPQQAKENPFLGKGLKKQFDFNLNIEPIISDTENSSPEGKLHYLDYQYKK